MGDESPHLRIYKWDELQHYKNREPPWIKLYNRLLDHYEYGRLPDASKGQYTGLLMLASRHQNRIPLDVDWIAGRINATEPVDLRPLVSAGLIELYHSDSATLAQDDSNSLDLAGGDAPSREAETEAEERESSGDSLPTVENTPDASVAENHSREDGNRWSETVTACREYLWLADQPPDGRTVGQELSVAEQLTDRWNLDPPEVAEAVEGFGKLRDAGFWEGWIERNEPAKMLALNRTPEDEQGIPVVVRSLHEMRKGEPASRADSGMERLEVSA